MGRLLMPEPVKPGSSGGGVIDQDIEQAPANLEHLDSGVLTSGCSAHARVRLELQA